MEIVKLKDICIGNGSYGIGASAVDKNDTLPTYLRITDIKDDGTIDLNSLKSVDDCKSEEYVLEKNDIVFARTGNSTGKSYFYNEKDGKLVYAGFLIKFSLDPQKVNPAIMKFYTHSKPYYDWVHSFDTGATRGNINAKTFGDMEITLPEREQQDRIVSILSSLDAKIETNNRLSEKLEELAQTIFKSWFVDFEPFKNQKFHETELGMIPEGWEVGNLTDIAEYTNGLAMQKFRPDNEEDGIPVLKIKELKQGSCDSSSDMCTSEIDDCYLANDGDVIFSWSGTLYVDIWCGGLSGVNQNLFKVTSNKYPKWFYYYWTKHHLAEFIRIAKDKAVTMGHIKREHLRQSYVVLPDKTTMDKIDKILSPIVEQIISSRIEAKRLANLRDTLLPRLMSGEIKL